MGPSWLLLAASQLEGSFSLREIEVTRVLVAHKGLENSCVLCPAHVCHSKLFEVTARRFGHLSKKDVAVSTLVQ